MEVSRGRQLKTVKFLERHFAIGLGQLASSHDELKGLENIKLHDSYNQIFRLWLDGICHVMDHSSGLSLDSVDEVWPLITEHSQFS